MEESEKIVTFLLNNNWSADPIDWMLLTNVPLNLYKNLDLVVTYVASNIGLKR